LTETTNRSGSTCRPASTTWREGWLGEVEGLQVSYSGVKDKLTQIDTTLRRSTTTTELGTPSFAPNRRKTPSAMSSQFREAFGDSAGRTVNAQITPN